MIEFIKYVLIFFIKDLRTLVVTPMANLTKNGWALRFVFAAGRCLLKNSHAFVVMICPL